MQVEVLNINGEKTGKTVALSPEIFGIAPNDHVIYLDVKRILADKRQGTHKTKERADVARSTRKLKRQKGTGGARAGSLKSPLFKGGGTIFGPRPRDYSFKLNKKVKRLARLSALAYKALENNIIVLEDFNMESPKTKSYEAVLNALSINGQRSLIVLEHSDNSKNIVLSARNIQKAETIDLRLLNTYDVLKAKKLIFSVSSLEKTTDFLLNLKK
jgi:large subunit ribosomal protein L4